MDELEQSEEVQDIFTSTPHWMLRWGYGVIFSFLGVLLLLSIFIQYPDVIEGNIIVTSEHPAISIFPSAAGRIDTVLVNENDTISSDQVLAIMASSASYNDIQLARRIGDTVAQYLENIDTSGKTQIRVNFPELTLDEVQSSYLEFSRAVFAYNLFVILDGYSQSANAIHKERNSLLSCIEDLQTRNRLLATDVKIGESRFKADSGLYATGAISKYEFFETQSGQIQKQYGLSNAEAGIVQYNMQISTLDKEKAANDLGFKKELNAYINEIHIALTGLLNQICTWEHSHVIRSPIRGIVTLFDVTTGKTVEQGDELFVVSPLYQGNIIGKIKIPVEGSAKVRRSQTVNIKLADYPFQEYGQLTGNVTNISFVPKDSAYWIAVEFPLGLRTNVNDTLEFRQVMSGTCQIITQRRSVFDRILGNLRLH